MKNRFSPFLEKHQNIELAKNVIENQKEEIEVYNKYKNYYSYGFYIAKKT